MQKNFKMRSRSSDNRKHEITGVMSYLLKSIIKAIHVQQHASDRFISLISMDYSWLLMNLFCSKFTESLKMLHLGNQTKLTRSSHIA